MQENYRLTNPLLHYSLLFFMFAVGAATLFSHALFHNQPHTYHDSIVSNALVTTAECNGSPAHSYTLTFEGKLLLPASISAERCDQLTVSNHDHSEHAIAFGPHEHHTPYPGFQEKDLAHGESTTFRLAKTGTFLVHDHDDDTIVGSLIVR